MLINNSSVFKNSSTVIKIKVTKEVRTVQSADAFLSGMKKKINTENITKKVDDTTLRFYDLAPSYLAYEKNGNWKTSFTKLQQSEKYGSLIKHISQRFFTPGFSKNLSDEEREDFTSDLYGFATIINSIEKEIQDANLTLEQVDFQSFFSCKELESLSKINEAEDFLLKGPGMDANGIQVKIAAPLLADFIKTTDEYIQTKAVNVQLRFTHAEAIAPFAALLGIANASKSANNITSLNSVWKASLIVPLSANVQWILYKKNASEDYSVKFLLNEKETTINGLKTKNFFYYNWSDVRAFYMKKLNTLNVELKGDGFAFLQSVK
jgi:translation initiation factor 2 beta subunit (eIF-2beta)/eIF-5